MNHPNIPDKYVPHLAKYTKRFMVYTGVRTQMSTTAGSLHFLCQKMTTVNPIHLFLGGGGGRLRMAKVLTSGAESSIRSIRTRVVVIFVFDCLSSTANCSCSCVLFFSLGRPQRTCTRSSSPQGLPPGWALQEMDPMGKLLWL